MIRLNSKTRNELWWLIINVDYVYSRIAIADCELDNHVLTLWLEDKQDYKNRLDECLQLQVNVKDFARIIKNEQLNSYEDTHMHTIKKFLYKTRTTVNEPIHWYQYDATPVEQRWAREALLKSILTQLVETETCANFLNA